MPNLLNAKNLLKFKSIKKPNSLAYRFLAFFFRLSNFCLAYKISEMLAVPQLQVVVDRCSINLGLSFLCGPFLLRFPPETLHSISLYSSIFSGNVHRKPLESCIVCGSSTFYRVDLYRLKLFFLCTGMQYINGRENSSWLARLRSRCNSMLPVPLNSS